MSADLVIFDVDGTLVDSTYLHALAWARVFDGHGHRRAAWRVHRAIGMGGDKLVPHLLGERVEASEGDDLREQWEREYEPLSSEAHPLPGAAELVRSLHQEGFVVAAASSGQRQFTDEAIEALGIGDLLEVVTSAADVDASKPEPDLLEVTCRRAGADRAVMVGDSVYDVESASRLGLACVTVRTGGFGVAELEEAGAAVVLEELTGAAGVDWAGLMRAPQT